MSAVRGEWTYWVGLGANLGEPEAQLERALVELERSGFALERRSRWWRTAPVGGPPGQPDYLNGVVRLRGRCTPLECLRSLQRVEWGAGRRRRGALRWGPRPLDLDLLDALPPDGSPERRAGAWGWVAGGSGAPNGAPRLVLPHPRIAERAFVLGPWAEIAPSHVLPSGDSVASLLNQLGAAPGA